jgi:hypothetical protein
LLLLLLQIYDCESADVKQSAVFFLVNTANCLIIS